MEQYSAIIKDFLIKRFDPYLIILFGSAGRNEMNEQSDLDIGFLSYEEHEEYSIFMTAQSLAGKLGREVDLVDIRNASSVFRVQIIGSGKEIYNSDPIRSALFKMRALKEYALLNEERQCILDKVKERGSIYAK